MRSYIWFPLTGTKASLLTFRTDPASTGPVLSVSFGGCRACDAINQGHISPEALPPPDSNVSINCRAVTNGVQLTGTTLTLTAKLWLLMDVIRRVKSLSRSFYTTVPPPSATLHSLMYMRGGFLKHHMEMSRHCCQWMLQTVVKIVRSLGGDSVICCVNKCDDSRCWFEPSRQMVFRSAFFSPCSFPNFTPLLPLLCLMLCELCAGIPNRGKTGLRWTFATPRSQESFSDLQATPEKVQRNERIYYLGGEKEKSEDCERKASMGVELKPSLNDW